MPVPSQGLCKLGTQPTAPGIVASSNLHWLLGHASARKSLISGISFYLACYDQARLRSHVHPNTPTLTHIGAQDTNIYTNHKHMHTYMHTHTKHTHTRTHTCSMPYSLPATSDTLVMAVRWSSSFMLSALTSVNFLSGYSGIPMSLLIFSQWRCRMPGLRMACTAEY